MLPLLFAGLFLLFSFLAGLVYHSLREFSLSRLESICNERNQSAQFGVILKSHERALLAWEMLLFASNTGFALSLCWCFISPLAVSDVSSIVILESIQQFLPWMISGVLFLFVLQIIVSRVASGVIAEKLLFQFWGVIAVGHIVMQPLVRVVEKLDLFAHRLAGLKPPSEDDGAIIAEEIRSAIDEGQREGVLESEAGTMIHRVMELSEDDVDSIMTPRTDMSCIQVETSLEEARTQLLTAGAFKSSRVP